MSYSMANAVECQFHHDDCRRPSQKQLDGIHRGSLVKIDFIDGPFDECMWVVVASRDKLGTCTGYLDDIPNQLENIGAGDLVHFTVDNVCRIYNRDYIRDVVVKLCHGIVPVLKTWWIYIIKGKRAVDELKKYEERNQ